MGYFLGEISVSLDCFITGLWHPIRIVSLKAYCIVERPRRSRQQLGRHVVPLCKKWRKKHSNVPSWDTVFKGVTAHTQIRSSVMKFCQIDKGVVGWFDGAG